jgi:hypothetical protein
MKRIAWHLLALVFALARPTPSSASSVSEDTPTSFGETQSKEFEKLKEELLTPLGPQETNTTDSYNRTIGEQIRKAEFIDNAKSLFKGVKCFKVQVFLSGEEDIISKEELKTKVELSLRRNGIKIDQKTGEKQIWVTVSCIKRDITTAYSANIEIIDVLYHRNENQFVKLIAPIWRQGTFGYAGRQVIRSAIIETTVDLVDLFSNAYLSQNSDTIASPAASQKPAAKKPAQKK